MPEKQTHWILTGVEKNGITEQIEKIIHAPKGEGIYDELWAYIEGILNATSEAVSQKTRKAKETHD